MSTIEQENQGYTPKEQDLIRQLVQARLEQRGTEAEGNGRYNRGDTCQGD